MATKTVQDSSLTAIADAIRAKTGKSASMEFPSEFVSEIGSISGGGGWIERPTGDKTRFCVSIPAETTFPLHIAQTVSNGVSVDWGDGSQPETVSGTGRVSFYHLYNVEGHYNIDITVASGCKMTLGGASNYHVFKDNSDPEAYEVMVHAGFIGARVSLEQQAFNGCRQMAFFEMPPDLTSVGYNTLNNTGVHKYVLPTAITAMTGNDGVPNGHGLNEIVLHDELTQIGGYAFANARYLTKLTIPSKVQTIQAQAITAVVSLKELHLKPTTPPSLASPITNMPSTCAVYVPYSADHSVLAAYQSATNWSTFASQMQEEV